MHDAEAAVRTLQRRCVLFARIILGLRILLLTLHLSRSIVPPHSTNQPVGWAVLWERTAFFHDQLDSARNLAPRSS